MLHAGLDLSRRKLDVCLLSESGEHLDQLAAPPDAEALRTLARRIDEVYREPVCAVIESMTGARLVHDTLEQEGWDVEIADAQKVKGLAPLACKTDKIDSQVLAVLSQRELVPANWLPDPRIREERELARFRLHLVKHKSALKNRVHSTLINFGKPCPVTDLFGVEGRKLLARRRPPLHRAAFERTRNRLGARLHDRRRDRPDRAVPVARETRRLHRPLPARQPVRRQGSPRPADQARSHLAALGAARGDDARAQAPRLRQALPAQQAPARQAARRQGRPDRHRPPTHPRDLAHAFSQPTVRSPRRRFSSGGLTALFGHAPASERSNIA
jgi:Transposase